jgi:hypothetical protein
MLNGYIHKKVEYSGVLWRMWYSLTDQKKEEWKDLWLNRKVRMFPWFWKYGSMKWRANETKGRIFWHDFFPKFKFWREKPELKWLRQRQEIKCMESDWKKLNWSRVNERKSNHK